MSSSTPLFDNARRHELKTWPVFFESIRNGDKTFEVRKNDRSFQRGDVLWLREWHPGGTSGRSGYTGNDEYRTVTYVLTGDEWGIKEGYCVMGLSEVADGV